MFDTEGLFLHIRPNGSKLWRPKYRFGGKEKLLALGAYPHITLKEARQRRDEERNKLAHHIDPAANRKATKEAWNEGLDEVLNIRPDYIEHQLAHAVRDPNGRAYNRTAHLPERRTMMQQWANYLDGLREQK